MPFWTVIYPWLLFFSFTFSCSFLFLLFFIKDFFLQNLFPPIRPIFAFLLITLSLSVDIRNKTATTPRAHTHLEMMRWKDVSITSRRSNIVASDVAVCCCCWCGCCCCGLRVAALEFCCLWAIAGKVLFCTFSPEKVKTKQNYPKQIKRFEEKPAKLEGLVNGEKKITRDRNVMCSLFTGSSILPVLAPSVLYLSMNQSVYSHGHRTIYTFVEQSL